MAKSKSIAIFLLALGIFFWFRIESKIYLLPTLQVNRRIIVRNDATFVSIYIPIEKAKQTSQEYNEWIENFLSLNDNMIVYTKKALIPFILSKRTNDVPITVLALEDIAIMPYDESHWTEEHYKDPEASIHTPELYYVWSLKTKLLKHAAEIYGHRYEYFMWSDIGCYRSRTYWDTSQLMHISSLVRTITVVNIQEYTADEMRNPAIDYYDRCGGDVSCRRIAAAQFGCKREYCVKLANRYAQTVEKYGIRFTGNDQSIMSSLCKKDCEMFSPKQWYGDVWVGLQPVLNGMYRPLIRRPTITIANQFDGRIGNQLFQLNAGVALAKRIGGTYCLHSSFSYGSYLEPLNKLVPCRSKTYHHVNETAYATFDKDLDARIYGKANTFLLDGYFQSHKYFDTEDFIKLRKVKTERSPVAIHVRFGDKETDDAFFKPIDDFYTDNIGSEKSVIVVTDDMHQARSHPILGRYRIRSSEPLLDFWTLVNSDKIVCALSSTFCWWAAMHSSNATVVYYDKEFNMEHKRHKGKLTPEDYYLSKWTRWTLPEDPVLNTTTKKYAFVTMLTDKLSQGAIHLGKSILKNAGPREDMILLVTDPLLISHNDKFELETVGWKIMTVPRIVPPNEEHTFPRSRDQFTKLHTWNMTQYNRVVYLDVDTLVVGNINGLLANTLGDKFAVARDIKDGVWQKTFNTGVFSVVPSRSEYEMLLELMHQTSLETAMAEQGFLNEIYKDSWHEIGFKYNANLAAYTQLPIYWQSEEPDVRVIHYTMSKPCASRAYEKFCTLWRSYKFK